MASTAAAVRAGDHALEVAAYARPDISLLAAEIEATDGLGAAVALVRAATGAGVPPGRDSKRGLLVNVRNSLDLASDEES